MGFGGPHAAYIAVRDGLRAGSCRARWWACRWTPTATRPTGSRCRPGSSTSAARRRPATSAPHRCCSPSSPAMYAVYHGPRRAGARSPARVHGKAAALAAALRARGRRRRVSPPSSTPSPSRGLPGGAARPSDRARRGRCNVCAGGRRHGRRSPATRRPPTATRGEVAARAYRRVRPARRARPRRGRPGGLAPHRPTSPTRCSSAHRSETAMLRYLRRLADCDIRARPVDDPARLVHDEAQRGRRRWSRSRWPGVRRPCTRSRRPTQAAGLRRADRRPGGAGWPRSPATTRCRVQPNAGSQGELAGPAGDPRLPPRPRRRRTATCA